MNKEEIKEYLKRVDELWDKLTGEDKETLQWLIYGYNKCAKLLNETEQQCKNQKEVIDKAIEYLYEHSQYNDRDAIHYIKEDEYCVDYLLDILKESGE